MTIPGNMSLVTIQGRFILLDGTPMTGVVSFSPSPSVILNLNAEVIISGSVFSAPLDATGFFTIDLPATDDPDLNPINFSYRVQEPTGRTYSISAPMSAGIIDLVDVQQVPNSPGQTSLLLRGASISSVEVSPAGVMTVYYDDSRTQVVAGSLLGPAGAVWRGAWLSTNAYAVPDVVSYLGSSYIAKSTVGTGGTNPAVTPAIWDLLAAKGDQGVQGNTGAVGITWRGPWLTSNAYAIRDAVSYNGSSYVATASVGTGGTNPAATPASWQLMAQRGDPGAGSVDSVNGNPGPIVVLGAADVGAVSAIEFSGHAHDPLGASGIIPAGINPVVAHNLGTSDVSVTVQEVSTRLIVSAAAETVDAAGAPSNNHVRFSFSPAAGAGQYRYLIFPGPTLAPLGDRLFVQNISPGLITPGMWVQTGLGPTGNDMTIWIEDGV